MAQAGKEMKCHTDQGSTLQGGSLVQMEKNSPQASPRFNFAATVRWLVWRIQLLLAVEGRWLQIRQDVLDVLKRPKIQTEIGILPVFSRFLEVHEHARAAGLAEHVRLQFGGKAILNEIVLAREKRNVFSLWVDEKIAVLGAN